MRSTKTALATVVLWCSAAAGQQYVISTYAGGAPPPTPVLAADLPVGSVSGIAADAIGNVYFTSPDDLDCVFKLDQSGVLMRIAGNSRPGYSGDGGPATSAQLNGPTAVAVDSSGNVFILDSYNVRIRKVSASGIITTVAGDGVYGRSGDGGPATSAHLSNPAGLAVDGAGNVFFAELGRVRRVSNDGIIATVAGNETQGFSGDGGPATMAQLNLPGGVAVDSAGNLFIADTFNRRIRMVSNGGIITTVAENVSAGSVAMDGAGILFVTDISFARILKVSASGLLTAVAGGGTVVPGDGGPATNAALSFPTGVAVDAAGNLFIADSGNNRIRKVSTDGTLTTVTGGGNTCCFSGDGGPAVSAQLNEPSSLAVDGAGNLFIAGSGNSRVRKVSPDGIISTVAGNGSYGFSGDGGSATNAQLNYPAGVAVDGAGNLFIADYSNHRVRKVSPSGIITTVAGNGAFGFSGDGGPPMSAALSYPTAVAVDGTGNLFIADNSVGNCRVRRVSPDGIITTAAGAGTYGFSGDGGPAIAAQLNYAAGVVVDGAGNLLIADYGNYRIRQVSPSGIITTVAGNGTAGYSGDGGPATNAALIASSVALDGAGNLFLAASAFTRVRKITPGGIIITVAGNGTAGYSGDGGPATGAALGFSLNVAADSEGNVYIADGGDDDDIDVDNNAVRILRPTNQSVLIGSVLDAARESAEPVTPGKIVIIYGAGFGSPQLIQNQPGDSQFGTEAGGTTVSFNGIAAPVLYASATQVAAIVPYAISGTTAQVAVKYQGQASAAFSVSVAPSAPSLFTSNQTGAGQAAATNAVDGTVNTATNPVKIGDYISLYATGEGQTAPTGVDGRLGGSIPAHPLLPVTVTVGGIPAKVQYAGGALGQVAGLMQVNVQIPGGVQPGGYVPVVLQVGDASTTPGAVWIAVSGN